MSAKVVGLPGGSSKRRDCRLRSVHGVLVGVHRIKRLRRKLGLRCKQRRKFKVTTDSRHSLPVAENLLEQRFQAATASQAWLGDSA
jgi:putative transposase